MNITEAHETVRLLRHLDRSQPDVEIAYDAAVYLGGRASEALQVTVTLDASSLAVTLSEIER